MVNFFLVIFSAGIGVLILWLLLRAVFRAIAPLFHGKKSLKSLNHLISQSRYDRPNITWALKCYVPPKCIERAPSKADIRKGRFGYNPRDLFDTVHDFTRKDKACKILLIHADSCMGKTSFLLNFYLQNRKQQPTALIPLNLENAEELIDSIPSKKDTVLLLDGLDEDARSNRPPFDHLIFLAETTNAFKKVIITSCENFIPANKFSVKKNGYDMIASPNDPKNRVNKLKRLYFTRMNLTRSEQILDQVAPVWQARKKRKILHYIQSNSKGITPFTLRYLPQILPEEPALLSKTFLYERIAELWLNDQFHWSDKQQLFTFMKKLAANLYLKRHSRREERISINELKTASKDWGIEIRPFQKDEHALISLTPSGHYRFTHRSILEFFFVRQMLTGDKTCSATELTRGMKEFLFESLEKGQPNKLNVEFQWLAGVELRAQGLKHKSQSAGTAPPHLLKSLLNKNPRYGFLTRLPRLLSNPIFAEFGWDGELYKNLKKAVEEAKSSFMRFERKRWDILINTQKIEITKRARETNQIPLKQELYEEYAALANDERFNTFCASVGLRGLRMINNINLSGRAAVVPDMETFNKFTLFFWRSDTNET